MKTEERVAHTPQPFRKKPVVIEALEFTVSAYFIESLRQFCGDKASLKIIHGNNQPYGSASAIVQIDTLEGQMTANVGDWIIRGIKGEFYPCKPEIFDASYESVSDQPSSEQPSEKEIRTALVDALRAATEFIGQLNGVRGQSIEQALAVKYQVDAALKLAEGK